MKNLNDDRRIYMGGNHEIFSLAVVRLHGLHFYNELWRVMTDADGKLYASVETGVDAHGKYEDRFYFGMEDVHREDEIEIGLYKEVINLFSCERFYETSTVVLVSSLAEQPQLAA